MKLKKSTILILCLLLFASITNTTERASISATATVIPSLGLMPDLQLNQSLSVTTKSDSKLFIQTPKNSTLFIHIKNANKTESSFLLHKQSSQFSQKNSVSDIQILDLEKMNIATNAKQIVTIIPIDN